jgi:hypothetical protein
MYATYKRKKGGGKMINNPSRRLAEVWGDTVVLKELFMSSVLGIVLTMTGYILGTKYFTSMETLDSGLAKGYSLMIGILGCVLAGVVSAILFKPKRIVEEKYEQEDIEEVLKAAGMSLEEEAQALANVDPDILEELKELNLKALLDLREIGFSNMKAKKGGEVDVNI